MMLNPTNLVYGGVYRWMFYNSTGAIRTGITWDSHFKVTNPNPTLGPSKVQIWTFEYDGTYLHQIGPTPTDVG